MADFPPHGFKKEHSEYLRDGLQDDTMRQEMEGGYEITRSRTTREPRRLFSTGWEIVTESEKQILQNFQKSVGVTNLSFTWEHPTSREILIVKFTDQINFTYKGQGKNHVWECKNINLREV